MNTNKFYIAKYSINLFKKSIFDNKFKIRNSNSCKDFTRNRKLPYESMITIILQKGVKSLQLRLNEFFDRMNDKFESNLKASAAAFSKARQKLKHTAFIELNEMIFSNNFYRKEQNDIGIKTWNGFRLLAIDGSKLVLPINKETEKDFGIIKNVGYKRKGGNYVGAMISVLYDVLNNIAIDSILEKAHSNERNLAIRHIRKIDEFEKIEERNLIILDRGYYSLEMFLNAYLNDLDFVFRIPRRSYTEITELFEKDCIITSKTLSFNVGKQEKTELENIKVRFVRVVLDNGEIEVLGTSLIDEEKYQNKVFKELYFKRWGIETYFNVLKNRLGLENFSGTSIEAIKQDIFSTIFLSNFETLMTSGVNKELEEKSISKNLKNKQKVNKNVSFNVIKNKIMDLILDENISIDDLVKQFYETFMLNPTQERIGRKARRNTTTHVSRNNYLKRKKKHCF